MQAEKKPKYKVGDRVKIINYGSTIWEPKNVEEKLSFPVIEETEHFRILDMSPDLVGKEGVVDIVTITQGEPKYAIDGLRKHAWYDEEQMELVLPKMIELIINGEKKYLNYDQYLLHRELYEGIKRDNVDDTIAFG